MTDAELSLRLARPAEATTIANLSRDLIEYGLQWTQIFRVDKTLERILGARLDT